MTLTFLELELPLQDIRNRLHIEPFPDKIELEDITEDVPVNWDRLILETVRQQLPTANLLRWAVTSACESKRVITVEIVATH
ncbi:MAG: hypothetical protein AB4050_09680 [Synechococcus sp.]